MALPVRSGLLVAALLCAAARVASAQPSSESTLSLPSPTCALNGLPCPPPTFEPSWNLTESTVIQPSSSGFFMPKHPYGLISLDWTVANTIWFTGNKSNSTCEATSITGCRMLKAAGLVKRCFIYHNMELALEWLESQRAVMYDPSKADFFLRYPNGTIYNEPQQDHGWGDQFFFNHTNPAAAAFFVESVVASLADDATDGTFTDDVSGVPQEHPLVQSRINMTDAELAALQYATQATSQELINAAVLAGKYNWQAFGGGDGTTGGISASTCGRFMAKGCAPAMQGRPLMMSMDSSPGNANQSVAAFLITRPPYGFLGWGWQSGDEKWDDIFYLQAGEPLGLCQETAPGVFSREWSLGTATLDCNSYTASLPFLPLAH